MSDKLYDANLRENKFNEFYDKFFNEKLAQSIKNLKRDHYECAQSCVDETNINRDCLKQCESKLKLYSDKIESSLKQKLAGYSECASKCESSECIDRCITKTINALESIKIPSSIN